MFVDASRAQRELGFQPGPVVGALERAVRWYRANGYVFGAAVEENQVGSVKKRSNEVTKQGNKELDRKRV